MIYLIIKILSESKIIVDTRGKFKTKSRKVYIFMKKNDVYLVTGCAGFIGYFLCKKAFRAKSKSYRYRFA